MKKGKRLLLLLAATLSLVLAFTVSSFAIPAPKDQDPVTNVPYFNQGLVIDGWTYGDDAANHYSMNTDYTATVLHSNCEGFETRSYSTRSSEGEAHTGYAYNTYTDQNSSSSPYTYYDYNYDTSYNNNYRFYGYNKYRYAYNNVHFFYTNDSAIQYARVADADEEYVVNEDNVDWDRISGWTTEVPKDAGKYVARVWFHKKATTPTYTEGEKAYSNSKPTGVYYENMHEPDAPDYDDYGDVIYGDHYEYALFTIEPKEITDVTWPEEDESGDIFFEYDGKKHTPKALAVGTVGDDVCEVEVLRGGTDVGIYNTATTAAKVTKLSAVSNKNYKLAKDFITKYQRFTITAKAVTLTWPEDQYVYNKATVEPVATPDIQEVESEITYKYYDKEYYESCDDDNPLDPEEAIEPEDVGEYVAVASLGEGSNYALDPDTAVFNFEIVPYELQVIDWSDSTYALIYNGHSQKPEATATAVFNREEGQNPETVTLDLDVAVRAGQRSKDAGTYSAKAMLDRSSAEYKADNYTLPEVTTHEFTILAKPVTVVWKAKSNDEDVATVDITYKYDGEAHKPYAEVEEQSGEEIEKNFVWDGKLVYGDEALVVVTEVAPAEYAGDVRYDKDKGGIDASIDPFDEYNSWKYTATAVKLTDENGNVSKNYTLINSDTLDAYKNLVTNPAKPDKTTRKMQASTTEEFAIEPVEATVIWTKESTYNGTVQLPKATVSVPVKGDTADVASYHIENKDDSSESWDIPADNGGTIDAGVYAISDVMLDNSNYYVAEPEDPVLYEIKQSPITVKANDSNVMYGDEGADNGVTFNKFYDRDLNKDGSVKDGVAEYDLSYEFPDYSKSDVPGKYTVKPVIEGWKSRNYEEPAIAAGTLKVNDKATVLVAAATAKGKKGLKFTWNEVNHAASYEIYLGKCNTKSKKYKVKKIATVKGSPLTFTKKKLKARTAYKFYVVAKDANGKVISQSVVGHVLTSKYRGKYTNAKSMGINATSVTVAKNGKAQLTTTYKKAKKGKKLLSQSHAALTRYTSENPAVATVDANGVITGVSTGWCRVYAQGVNGIWSTVEVTVK